MKENLKFTITNSNSFSNQLGFRKFSVLNLTIKNTKQQA